MQLICSAKTDETGMKDMKNVPICFGITLVHQTSFMIRPAYFFRQRN